MKHRQSLLMLLATLCGVTVLAVIITVTVLRSNQNLVTPVDTTEGQDTTSTTQYPLYMTTMTHMEGGWDFVLETEHAFNQQNEKLEFGMDIAEEYGGILTIETEEPYARANQKWGRNMMKEVLDRGHGVGSHCDRGSKGTGSYEAFVEELGTIKSLVDELVGAENNKGCSGAGSSFDWVEALSDAGFSYVDGIVGYHMLAFPIEERPTGWNDRAIASTYYHDNVPVDLEERIHLFRLENTDDFEPDSTGIVVSSGEAGRLAYLAEGDRTRCMAEGCLLTNSDIEEAVDLILEAAELHDASRVAKLSFHLPTAEFVPENEDVLRYFFAEMRRLEDAGVIMWGSQIDVYNAYVSWEQNQ